MPSTTTTRYPVQAEPSSLKPSKRQPSARSVSTLTPAQLSHKRAKDRVAQRTYRETQRALIAGAKERNERLERELQQMRERNKALEDELQHMRDRNKALEDELSRLRESRGISIASSPYSGPAPCDQQHGTPGTIPTPRMSPLAASADYSPLPDYGQHYVPMSDSSVNSWDANVSSYIGFNVLSPSSSIDDYVSGYIPTCVPMSMISICNSFEPLDNYNMQLKAKVYTQQQQYRSLPPPQSSFQGDWSRNTVYYSSQVKSGETYLSQEEVS